MRCGAQGHVAEPRGLRECLRGTEVTYTIFFITYGYITYKPSIEDFANRIIRLTL